MRFAFAGFDRWHGVFDSFIAAGWEPVALFTIPLDDRHDFNRQMVERADKLGIPVQLSRIREDDLRRLAQQQCDALIVAGYQWKIPDWREHLRFAANFHPAPLPEGRGPYPLMQAIREDRREWGISCHRIDTEFDTGELIASEHFPLDAHEWHETLQLKLQMAAKRLAVRVSGDFERLWSESRPQGDGSYWPRISDADRTIDYTRPVAEAMRIVRACGLIECIAPLYGGKAYVHRAVAWQEAHQFEPGSVVHEYHRWVVIAAVDGFVALLEWSPFQEPMRRRMTF